MYSYSVMNETQISKTIDGYGQPITTFSRAFEKNGQKIFVRGIIKNGKAYVERGSCAPPSKPQLKNKKNLVKKSAKKSPKKSAKKSPKKSAKKSAKKSPKKSLKKSAKRKRYTNLEK